MYWRPSIQGRRNGICWRIVTSPWTNLLARLQNGQKACDKRVARLISYIHHTCEFKQYCHVGNCKTPHFVGNDRQCTMYIHSQLPSVPQSWSSGVSVLIIRHLRALGKRLKKTIHGIWHTVIMFLHGSVVIGDETWDVTHCARGAQGSLLDALFVWWIAGGGRSAVVSSSLVDLVCWIVVACRACVRWNAGRAVVERFTWQRGWLGIFWNVLTAEFPNFWRVSMSMTMEQVVTQLQQDLFHSQNSSGSRIWTCRRSASDQQSRDSSSSERLRVSSMWEASVVGRNSLAERRISNSGRRRRRHSSLLWSRSRRWCWSVQLSRQRKSRWRRLISSSCRRIRTRTEECKTWSLCCSRCTPPS